jgi:hypothetical protein
MNAPKFHTHLSIAASSTADSDLAGKVIWWSLSGDVRISEINAALDDAGLPEEYRLKQPSSGKRIERTLKQVAFKGQIVRPGKKGGYVLISEGQDAGGDNAYSQELRVWTEVQDMTEVLCLSDEAHSKADIVREVFAHHSEVVATPDVSNWLSTFVIKNVSAVSLRNTGGYYFIPSGDLPLWGKIQRVLEQVSQHEIYDLPAHTKATAMRAVMKAVMEEAELALSLVAEAAETNMNRRGIASRSDELDALTEKLIKYEDILGVTLGVLKDRAKGLKERLAAKLLADD